MWRNACLWLLLGFLHASAETAPYEYKEVENWVIENGGMINTYIGKNQDGYRSLFANVSAKTGEKLATITGASMINAGAIDGSFLTPTLTVLRELLHPASRFTPYIKVWPARDEVVNACNLKQEYLPLLESEHWVHFAKSWQDYLQASLEGRTNKDMEFIIPEMLGNVAGKLTLDDMKYACAISSTRYVAVEKRKRLMMIPIYDMANHVRDCPHYISQYDYVDYVDIIAGADVQPGDEICYCYGATIRDDYAVMHYGFLPALEDPPRLLMIDHHQFNPDEATQTLTEDRFSGKPMQIIAEIARLETLLKKLEDGDKRKPTPPPAEGDWVRDMLLQLQWRRRNALKYEINRLHALLTAQSHGTEL